MHDSLGSEGQGRTRARKIGYWIITGLLVAELLTGGIWDVVRTSYVVAVVIRLGYPLCVLTIVGVWKLLAVPALLAPGMGLLKEWAYAGVFFEMTGAAASHAASGEYREAIAPLLIAALVVVSWWLRPASRRCGSTPVAAEAQEAR